MGGLALLALLLLAQLVLPRLAERRIRGKLDDKAQVERVEVHAFPAVQLLWGHADRVDVRLGEVRASDGELAGLIDDAGGVDEIDASARTVRSGLVVLREARFRKQGKRLTGRGKLAQSDLRSAFPVSLGVRPVGVVGGTLVVRGGVSVLGQVIGVTARIVADAGAIVVQPQGIPFLGGLFDVTVFNDPRVSVQSLTARQAGSGYLVTATGRLT